MEIHKEDALFFLLLDVFLSFCEVFSGAFYPDAEKAAEKRRIAADKKRREKIRAAKALKKASLN